MTHTPGATILIVEDDYDTARLQRIRLEQAGYAVVTVSTSRAARRRLDEGGVALMLLDYRLSDEESGLEFYEQLRAEGREPPTILVTAFSDEPLVVRALRAGMRDYVSKSAEYLDYLPDAVERVLRQVAVERRLAESEERLRRSERQYRALVESARDVIFTLSPAGTLTSLNAAFETITGWPRDEWLGQPFHPLIHPDDLPTAAEFLGRALQSERLPMFELRIRCRSGGHLVGEFTIETDIRDGRVAGLFGIARDITERKRLEEQVSQAQKMESIGRLAGGIAHDFNNLLTIILGNAELMRDDVSIGPLRESLDDILEASRRAAALTRQLLAFGRKQMLEPVVLDMNALVSGTARLLDSLLGPNIELRMDLDRDLSPIVADSGQIEQIVMNLCLNARDAMPDGGRLTLETRNVRLDAETPGPSADLPPGRYVLLAVGDTGCGMDEEVKPRLFEPFFTTKPVGKGTGMGLPTVFGIVKQSDGHIAVETAPGRGSTFRIYLPAAEESVCPADTGPGPAGPVEGRETILLVEDEHAVRRLARRFLEADGYTVLEAAHGDEALWLSDRHVGPIQLLVTDLAMPGLCGRDVAAALTIRRPGLKVLYVSGFSDLAVVSGGQSDLDESPFLRKPFTHETLSRKIRQTLDRP